MPIRNPMAINSMGLVSTRQHQKVRDVQKTERGVEQNDVLKNQYLIQEINKKRYDLYSTYPTHF